MQEIGEVRKGIDISQYKNHKSGHSYIWSECPMCHILRWVRIRNGIAAFRYCKICNGARKKGTHFVMKHKRKSKIYILFQGIPKIGDVKLGQELGYNNFNNYRYVVCPVCGKERWQFIRYDRPNSGMCHSCYMKSRKGNAHPSWKGGVIYYQGYRKIWLEPKSLFYSMANPLGYVFEHRLVMAMHLGRSLTEKEVVHHLNQNKLDNSNKNLVLCSDDAEHKLKFHQHRVTKLNLK